MCEGRDAGGKRAACEVITGTLLDENLERFE